MKKQFLIALYWSSFIFSSCHHKNENSIVLAKQHPSNEKDSLAFGDKNWISDGLEGKIYFLPEGTSKLPSSFDTTNVQGSIYTKTLNVPERSWSNGFPGVSDRFEWFAIEYKGEFKPAKAGLYTFRLVSDDGSKLFIDDSLVINNDGTHGTSSATGSIELSRSYHRIKVQYFQGPRFYVALQLFAHLDKDEEQIFPGTYFTLSTPGRHSILNWILLSTPMLIILVLLIIFLRSGKKIREGKTA